MEPTSDFDDVPPPYPADGTYVLKLHRDAAGWPGRVQGRLEHVSSGRRFEFASGAELLACLIRCAAAASDSAFPSPPQPRGEFR